MSNTGELRFDGRVAIVTGAGGQEPSLGVAYARLLASRGARVVVNDLGIGPDGTGALPANAQRVVQQIKDAGGEAIGDTHNVADPASARAVVQTALDAWGRVDILINNAGIVMFTLFDEISENDVQRVINTHLMGNLWMARAVWPHMKAAGYGRIVNISSRSAFGTPYLSIYAAAKAGIIGLTNGLALESAGSGINVNTVAPDAITRKRPHIMGRDPASMLAGNENQVEQVAPVVAYLCHENCKVNGGLFWTGRGATREYRVYETAGYENPSQTIEDIDANIDRIRDQSGAADHFGGVKAFSDMPRKAYEPR